MRDYGFLTARGEDKASRAIQGILRDIEADRLTRKAALRRLADVLEAVSGLDGESVTSENLDAVLAAVNPAFKSAGFVPALPADVAEARRALRQDAAHVAFSDLPLARRDAALAARHVGEALDALDGAGWTACAHDEAPWHPAFGCGEGEQIALFLAAPQDCPGTSRQQLCGLLLGRDASQWLDLLGAAHAADPAFARDTFLALFPERASTVRSDLALLSRLARAVHGFNEALALSDQPLDVSLAPEGRPAVAQDGFDVPPSHGADDVEEAVAPRL